MKTHKTQFLTILAALMAAGLTAHAQYTFTNLDAPASRGTWVTDISGTNIIGYYININGNTVGACYNGSTWTTLVDPLADPSSSTGTEPTGISNTNIVGQYQDSSGVIHGFLYNGSFLYNSTTNWTTLDDPSAGSGSGQGTLPFGISDTNIVGGYYASDGTTHGFLYNLVTSNWTTLNDPLDSGGGTFLGGIDGTNIVGSFWNASGINHGCLYNGKTWTTLNDPLGVDGTFVWRISGTNMVGLYRPFGDTNNGFLYDGRTWTTMDDPLGVRGTIAQGISGANIVGGYYDSGGDGHGFLATPIPQLTITQSGNNLNISWPYWNNPSMGWILQQNADVTTTNWTPNGSTVSNDGTNNFITITPSPGNLFFRLSQQ
jgi:hypothetical protein